MAAIVCVDLPTGTLVGGPEIATRGWVAPEESEDLFNEIARRVRSAVEAALVDGVDRRQLEKVVRRAAGSYVGEKTRRRPMIVPVVVEA